MDYMEPIEFARHLRQASRSYEQLLWQLLRNRQRCGKKFRRQHPLGIYTADFYCVEAKLDVEVDGSPHDTIEGKQKDQARDAWMRSQGIEVLRFRGWQVESDTQQVLIPSPSPPEDRGRRAAIPRPIAANRFETICLYWAISAERRFRPDDATQAFLLHMFAPFWPPR